MARRAARRGSGGQGSGGQGRDGLGRQGRQGSRARASASTVPASRRLGANFSLVFFTRVNGTALLRGRSLAHSRYHWALVLLAVRETGVGSRSVCEVWFREVKLTCRGADAGKGHRHHLI